MPAKGFLAFFTRKQPVPFPGNSRQFSDVLAIGRKPFPAGKAEFLSGSPVQSPCLPGTFLRPGRGAVACLLFRSGSRTLSACSMKKPRKNCKASQRPFKSCRGHHFARSHGQPPLRRGVPLLPGPDHSACFPEGCLGAGRSLTNPAGVLSNRSASVFSDRMRGRWAPPFGVQALACLAR